MMQFDRISLGRQAKDLGFVRDTFEKAASYAGGLFNYRKTKISLSNK